MNRRGGGSGALRSLFLAAAIPLFGLYVATLSPTVPFEDGGEMIAPSFTLGIHHPPGYSLYALAGRLAACVPVGGLAFRYNLLSAAWGAAACGIVACVAFRLLAGIPGMALAAAWAASLVAALMLGTAPHVWWQSVIAEKYALNLGLNAILVLALVSGFAALAPGRAGPRARPGRLLALAGLAWGLSASHHGQTVYFIPAVFVLGWLALRAMPGPARLRAVVLAAAFAGFGLSLRSMYPPIRSAASPLFNWNAPSNAASWADYAGGGPYRYRILYWTPRQAASRIVRHLGSYPARQFGIPGVLVVLGGAWWLARRRRREMLALGLAAGTGVLYCVNFSLEGIAVQTYYIPVFMIMSLWMAGGIAAGVSWFGKRGPAALAAASVIFLGWAGWQAAGHGHDAARDRHYFAWDLSRALMRSCERGALLVAYGDYDLFPLWYTHYIEGYRPDIVLVNSSIVSAGKTRRVDLMFPPGHEALAKRFRVLSDVVERDPGRPVCLSVVYEAAEGYPLLPRGAAYRVCRDEGEFRTADVAAERRWFLRWRTIRGVLDPGIAKDSNTRTTLSYYAFGDYRRGYVLDRQGRADEAYAMYRRALGWPDFWGFGPAAARASIALHLYGRKHDVEGAIRECREAIRMRPEWPAAYRTLGAICAAEGRRAEAIEAFRKVVEIAPDDPRARADLIRAGGAP